MRSVGLAVLVVLASCRSLLGLEEPVIVGDAPDGDLPRIAFEVAESGADELAATLQISIVLDRPADSAVSVTYEARGGTASPGEDFTVTSSKVELAPGELRAAIPITIVNDGLQDEAVETIVLELSAPIGAALGARVVHTIQIADHILPRVQFAAVTTSSSEGSPSSVMIVLDKPAEPNAAVAIGVSGGTPGTDYTIADNTAVPIPVGATSVLVPIGEIDDPLDEDDEPLALQLQNASPSLIVGAGASATHTIIDNDAEPIVSMVVTTSSVDENIAMVSIDVQLSAASGKSITVDYASNAASSASAADAMLAPGTLAFAPGETTKTITVVIANDVLDEPDENLIVDLANPVNASLGLATHTATITDDDLEPSIAFALVGSTVTEAGTAAMVSVALSTASGKTVGVSFTASGSATSPADFSLAAPSISFAPGETSKMVTVTIAADTLDEPDETANLALTAPVNATIALPSLHALTITDDDNEPIVNFLSTESNRSQNEGDGGQAQFTYTVVLSQPSGKQITVPILFTGAATNPTDYNVATVLPLVFAPGQTQKTLTYNVVRDLQNEPDEDIVMTIDPDPENAQRGAPNVRVHVINDDD